MIGPHGVCDIRLSCSCRINGKESSRDSGDCLQIDSTIKNQGYCVIIYLFIHFIHLLFIWMLLLRNIHLMLTLKSLCMNRLNREDEVWISNHQRAVKCWEGFYSDYWFILHLLLIYSCINFFRSTSGEYFWEIYFLRIPVLINHESQLLSLCRWWL